ncbi:MAG TPA: glycosyltransferase [Puia sp.]|nr:glycosyltransferase [Puia sp.]
MTIAFIHPYKAFLPEITAYCAFFNRYDIQTLVPAPEEAGSLHPDVEWYFMGRGGKKKKNGITIHEYSSASTPPLSPLKNIIKRSVTSRPDYRLFQNEYVRNSFRFRDNIPFGIRQHGMTPLPASLSGNRVKSYDFIYVGTVDKTRKLDKFFKHFISGPLRDHTLLVLSKDYQDLEKDLGYPGNIHFKGPVSPADVSGYILQASYGINFIPDRPPFNRQPSGKLLDYAACGTPVITTDYAWIHDFQKEAGGSYYYLRQDLSNFLWEEIVRFDYHSPDLTGWTWEEQIRQSGVLPFLQSKFAGLHF